MSWRGTLRHPDAPDMARWDWEWLEDCFGQTRISLSDVDGVLYAVERNGVILWIEIKRPSQPVPTGQRLLLQAFSRKERCSALILWGHKDDPREAQWIINGKDRERLPTNRQEVHEWIAHWFRDADRMV